MSTQQEPPVMWTRCHLCGKTVRTDECVREKRETDTLVNAYSKVKIAKREQMVDVCLDCKNNESKEEKPKGNWLSRLFQSSDELLKDYFR